MDLALSTLDLFKTLPAEITSELTSRSFCIDLPAQHVVFRQGAPGDCLYIVLEGAVSVYNESEEGREWQLRVLERGELFGEMALLTGQPRSASVRTTTNVRLMGIRKADFDRVVAAHPELVVTLARTISERLSSVNVDLARAEASQKAYQRLLSEYYAGPQVPLLGNSKAIREVMARADQLAASRGPVLIGGAPGTEKRSAAWRIHQAGENGEGPFVIFDPHQAHLGPSVKIQSAMAAELAQDTILFGCPPGLIPSMKSGRIGLVQAADAGTLVIENVDRLEPDVQEKLAEYLRTGEFVLLDGQRRQSTARIVGILSGDRPGPELSSHALLQAFGENRLSVPTLVRRKKDLALILDSMVESLGRRLGKKITGVEPEAYRAVVAYDWPGNVEELEIVVRRAIKLTESEQIRAEHVFIGVDEHAGPSIELLKQPAARKLFLSRYFPLAFQALVGVALLAVLFFSMTDSWSTGTDLALIAVWGIGEPLFLISTLATARFACSCCPFGRLSSLLSSRGLQKDPPFWMRRWGTHIAVAGLGVILWAEVATDMTHSPRATVILILSIMLLAMVFSLAFKRRTWCRFLCPLGSWVGGLATCSALELRGRTPVCNTDCTSHICYKGAEGREGCPVFEGPFSLMENSECVLCGDCIKLCPHNSPLVNLRLPARELWSSRRLSAVLPVLVPVMIATQVLRLADHAGLLNPLKGLDAAGPVLAVLIVLIWAVTQALVWGLRRLGAMRQEGDAAGAELSTTWAAETSVALTFVGLTPLVVGCEIAYQLGSLLGRGPEALAILSRLVGWRPLSDIVFLPWQITAVELVALSLGLGLTFIVEKKAENPRLRAPGITGAVLLYLLFAGLVLLA